MLTRLRGFTRILAVVALVAGALAAAGSPAGAAPRGPSGPIGPGTQVVVGSTVCSASFVLTDARGRTLVAVPARCAARRALAAPGCARTKPVGTRVRFTTGAQRGAQRHALGRTVGRGTLRWSSWAVLRRAGAATPTACRTHDLALVEVDRGARRAVDPTVPFWGGPTDVAAPGAPGSDVYTTGRVSRGPALSPRAGSLTSTAALFLPLAAGSRDTGAGLLDERGRAVGILGVVRPGDDEVVALAAELAWARAHGVPGLRLVPGRDAFSASTTG